MGRYAAHLPAHFALAALMAALLLLPSCNGKSASTSAIGNLKAGGTGDPPVTNSAQPPVELAAQLRQVLNAEFIRRGIDPQKVAAAAPSGADNAVYNLYAEVVDPDGPPDGHGGGELPPTGIELTWTERMIGDYDQNGEVNYSDITPLGLHFNSAVEYDDPALHGGFEQWPTGDLDDADPGAKASAEANWRLARIDGESNGELNFGDVTPLAVHWKERMDGYLIERAINYGTGELNWEPMPLDIGYGSNPSAPRSELATYAAATPVRYSATVPLTDPDHTTYFRVRSYDASSGTSGGEASNVVIYYPNPGRDTTPPYWTDTVGVQRLLPYVEQITVEFGTAADDESPPVTYRVYWAEGDPAQPDAPFDYESPQFADVPASPYVITGLTDDQCYRVAVRARDSADPANEETNTALLGATPGPRDVYPPEWTGRAGIADLFYGNGQTAVVFDSAIDSHSDAYGVWENGPVTYRVYYGLGEAPDWSGAAFAELPDIGLESYVVPIDGLDTTANRWFAVRALDQADIPNEDSNNQFLVGRGVSVATAPRPGPGPEVPLPAEELYGSGLKYTPEAGLTKFVTFNSANDGYVWASIYTLDATVAHETDLQIAPATAQFSIENSTLEPDGNLAVLYYTHTGIDGQDYWYYRQATDNSLEIELPEMTHVVWENFDIDGTPYICLAEQTGELLDPSYTYYMTTLPIQTLTPFWQTPDDKSYVNFTPTGNAARLSDGSIAFIARFAGGSNPLSVTKCMAAQSVVTWQPFEPFSEGYKLYSVQGMDVNQPVWIERLSPEQGSFAAHIYDGAETFDWQAAPPFKTIGIWDMTVAKVDCLAFVAPLETSNWYTDAGQRKILYPLELVEPDNLQKILLNAPEPPGIVKSAPLALSVSTGDRIDSTAVEFDENLMIFSLK